jgi:hypothetical protein
VFTSQKTPFFIVTAVKTSKLTLFRVVPRVFSYFPRSLRNDILFGGTYRHRRQCDNNLHSMYVSSN